MKLLFLIFTLCFIITESKAQVIDIKRKTKWEVERRANQKTDAGIDKGLDGIEKGIGNLLKKKTKSSSTDKGETEVKTKTTTAEAGDTEIKTKTKERTRPARTESRTPPDNIVKNYAVTISQQIRDELLTEGRYDTKDIIFKPGTNTLQKESFNTLEQIAALMKENEELKINVKVYADNTGSKQLALERAGAIKNYLTDKSKADENKIDVEGSSVKSPDSSYTRVEFIKN